MKSRDYSSVHELGQDFACSISRLASGVHEFKGVEISEPRNSDCYVSFGNVYGLSSKIELGLIKRSFSMQQNMYCVGNCNNPDEFKRGDLVKRSIWRIKEEVPRLAKAFFWDFNDFCSENPCYVMNRFRGNLEWFIGNKLSGGKGSVHEFKKGHYYNVETKTGVVYFELFKYESIISFLNEGSGLFLMQDFCLPSENNRVIEKGSRRYLDLKTDENKRLTNKGLNNLASNCFNRFLESYRKSI